MDGWIKNKKGLSTIFILYGILILFIGAILLIVIGSFAFHANEVLDLDIQIGQVNLSEVNEQTFGSFNTMVVNNADWWGTAMIFGVILGLFLTSYFLRGRFPKITILLDLFMIFSAFLVSLYLSAAYSTVVNALTSAGETFAVEHLPNTSFFILNMPLFVAVIGIVMMILFHSSIPRKQEEINNVSGLIPT